MAEFRIEKECDNAMSLTVRCQEWIITTEGGEDLTESDIEFWKNVVALLNSNSKSLLPSK